MGELGESGVKGSGSASVFCFLFFYATFFSVARRICRGLYNFQSHLGGFGSYRPRWLGDGLFTIKEIAYAVYDGHIGICDERTLIFDDSNRSISQCTG